MSGWGCPHEVQYYCKRRKKECDPGVQGCVLYGLVERKDRPRKQRDSGHRRRQPAGKRQRPPRVTPW